MWVGMGELDLRWVMWRRGITVRARYKLNPANTEGISYIAHFRTLDGQEITAHPANQGRRDEIRYDPKDPSSVLAPTRAAWLVNVLGAFMLTGFWGVVFGIPAAIWIKEVLLLPF